MTSEILNWGIDVLQYIETFRNPVLTNCFMFFHYVGNVKGYLVLVPLLFFLKPRDQGVTVLTVMLSFLINIVVKDWVAEPRPYIYGNVVNLVGNTSYSFPSGHAQISATFWGMIMLATTNRHLKIFSIFMIASIGLCRIYLGVHYPTDVLVGWILGLLIAYVMFSQKDRIIRTVSGLTLGRLLFASAAFSVIFMAINPGDDAMRSIGFIAGFFPLYAHFFQKYGALKGRLGIAILKVALGVSVIMLTHYIFQVLPLKGQWGTFLCFLLIGIWVAIYPVALAYLEADTQLA